MFCRGFGGYGPGFIGGFGSGFMFLAMVLRLIIIIAVIVIAVKMYKKYVINSDGTISILNEKFANGEISEEEYLKRKNILSQKK